jgi:ESCRT-I complex subunit VPS37
MALRDELFALRDATAQSYAHAEALKAQWAEIEKAQASYYQVCPLTDLGVNAYLKQKQRPSFLHLRLRHSITAQDDSSEKVANAFIEGRPLNGPSTPSMSTDSPAPGSESAGFSASSFSGVSTFLISLPICS